VPADFPKAAVRAADAVSDRFRPFSDIAAGSHGVRCYLGAMQPFPPVAELQDFVGDAIAQVWLDPHGVQFVFESMRRLVAEQRIEHSEPDGRIWAYDCEAGAGPPLILHRLLYRRIVGVEREELRLTFRFEDGSTLAILSELGPYESGHFCAADGDIVVF